MKKQAKPENETDTLRNEIDEHPPMDEFFLENRHAHQVS